ncbi:MAG: uroporphyrinogen-III synthase [Gaiellaceae bacterium]
MADTPLAGRRIVVTRPREHAESLARGLEALGATAVVLPLLQIEPMRDTDAAVLDSVLSDVATYDWIVFTSANGVAAVQEHLAGKLAGVKIAAVGPATAAAVRSLGVEPAFVPANYAAAEIVEGLGELDGCRVLLPQADIADPWLGDQIRAAGATVDAVVAYRTVAVDPSAVEAAELEHGVDAIVLASGSAARSLAALAAKFPGVAKALEDVTLVAIGPKTAEAAREVALPVGLVAGEASSEGIIDALTAHFGEEAA